MTATAALPRERATRRVRGLPLALLVWIVACAFLGQPSTWLSHDLLRLSPTTRLGSAVTFFVYEAPLFIVGAPMG